MRERFCPTGTRLAMEASGTSERLTARVPNLFCRSGHGRPKKVVGEVSSAVPPLLQRSLKDAGANVRPARSLFSMKENGRSTRAERLALPIWCATRSEERRVGKEWRSRG